MDCYTSMRCWQGPQYWRFENDILDPGYPQVIKTGFDGLRGHVTAALSVPEYRNRRESVYFFKRGDNLPLLDYKTCFTLFNSFEVSHVLNELHFQAEQSRDIHTSLAPDQHVAERSSTPFMQSTTAWLDKQVLHKWLIYKKILTINRIWWIIFYSIL